MNKIVIATLILLTLIVGGSLLTSCAQGEVTKTMTATTTVAGQDTTTTVTVTTAGQETTTTATPTPFTATVTVNPPDSAPITLTPVFDHTPPKIPHVYLIEDPSNPYIAGLIGESGGAICFECHGVPPLHESWVDDPNVCLECHVVSDNPVLIPR